MSALESAAVQVIVPLKAVPSGKTRLTAALEPARRERLIGTMLQAVLECLQRVRGIAAVSVLTPDARALPAGTAHLADAGLELNLALAQEARRLRSSDAPYLLVLAADVPLATPQEVEALLAARAAGALIAAPDWRNSGTNALLWHLRHPLTPCFGAQSLAAHAQLAQQLGLEFLTVRRPGLAFDVDEPEQLAGLRRRGGARYGFLG
ncbi:MAG TPA: 2-phospho-L-lactate guanylyltransferase [Steroidobacteraceae bacterium]|nr:2-phospho-L-lactate guanylyltransferase [Steroidobacteraceae bacterium]